MTASIIDYRDRFVIISVDVATFGDIGGVSRCQDSTTDADAGPAAINFSRRVTLRDLHLQLLLGPRGITI